MPLFLNGVRAFLLYKKIPKNIFNSMKLKDEYKTAMVASIHGNGTIEMLLVDEREWKYYAKLYPFMFEEEIGADEFLQAPVTKKYRQ